MDPRVMAYFAAGIGAALTIIGGASGIGRLAAAAMDGIARQPNAAGDIRGAMVLAAGLIEGVTFFSLIVCILLAIKKQARLAQIGAPMPETTVAQFPTVAAKGI